MEYKILIRIGLSTNRWFKNQKDAAEFVGVKNSSKASLISRCKKLNFGIEFNQ